MRTFQAAVCADSFAEAEALALEQARKYFGDAQLSVSQSYGSDNSQSPDEPNFTITIVEKTVGFYPGVIMNTEDSAAPIVSLADKMAKLTELFQALQESRSQETDD